MRKANTAKASEEFERFREITRLILAVPKKEIDQQKAEYEKKKKEKEKRPAK